MFSYQLRDLQLAALTPWRLAAQAVAFGFSNPFLPASQTEWGRTLAASAKLFERGTRPFGKPDFDLDHTKFRGEPIAIHEQTVAHNPFCRLVHFKRVSGNEDISRRAGGDPRVLIVTPLSGHFATLMRGTVEPFLPSHNVYITDWTDAKMVPLAYGTMDLDDQIEMLMTFLRYLGPDVHVIAISQASLTSLCAVSLLAAQDDSAQPRTLTLIGGPIDAREGGAVLTQLAAEHSISWFQKNQIQMVPAYYPGAFRMVYPGYLQLEDRMAMTLDQHITEQVKYFQHLVRGDEESAAIHEAFYDEFLAVMDVPAESYLDYVERAYQRFDLAKGTFEWRGTRVDPGAIRKTALLTVEGELDDLSPPGQTQAAHKLCTSLPPEMHHAHLEIGVGHYGVFSGRKWRNHIQPLIHKFIRTHALAKDEQAP